MRVFILSVFILSSCNVFANELDLDLAESLKIEANHNLMRVKSYKEEIKNNKVFDEERERGLSEHLEEQERWDLIRERGLREYRAQKREESPREGSFEHNQYLEELESQMALYEKSRMTHVATKKKFLNPTLQNTFEILESEELGLSSERPRYNLSLRGRNKWINSGKSTGISSSGGGGSGGFQPTAPPPVDFSPTPEFPPAPAPFEGSEEAQAPLPPPIFDSNSGGMTDFGSPSQDMTIPPPPPPPPDFDF